MRTQFEFIITDLSTNLLTLHIMRTQFELFIDFCTNLLTLHIIFTQIELNLTDLNWFFIIKFCFEISLS